MATFTNLTEQARKEANLRALQRIDASVVDILGSATHVVLYEFTSPQWKKLNVEGSLFLVQRSSDNNNSRFQLVVLNRNSTNNYSVDITSNFQLQIKDSYLMYKTPPDNNNKTTVQGLWFHNDQERQSIAQLLQKVVQSLLQGVSPIDAAITTTTAAQVLMNTMTIGGGGESCTSQQPSTPPIHRPQATPPSRVAAAAATPTSPNSSNATISPVLDKKSLQLALLSLLQDDRFLDLIHAQYLKVAHARANRQSTTKERNMHDENE